MPALDKCHPQVVRALEKSGWTISPKPYILRVDRGHHLHIDIEARRSQQEGFMVIEAKCFADPRADTIELYSAIGQVIVYRSLLKQREIDIPLFLAVPTRAYDSVFERMGRFTLTENQIKMIVVDLEDEVIREWLT